MSAIRPIASLAGLAATLLVPTLALGQSAIPTTGGLIFETNVGSFKMLGAGDDPARGNLTFSFEGTVLISGLDKAAKLTTTGNVRKELEDAKRGKTVYHGKGAITINGGVKAVQFFGRNLKGKFDGVGIFRLYGEFDKSLNTGFYQYTGSSERRPWGSGGMTLTVPSIEQATPKPKIRINPGGG